tara:strand:- start:442 stop:1920 length:1479 start_codon:yes stop_codon:yes gene_type:complete
MSKIKLTGSNSGYVEIDSAADAGNLTLQLPTAGTTLLSNADNVFTGITTFAGLNITDDVTFNGASYNAVWDKSDNQLEFATNAKISFGNSSELQLYHDGSSSYVKKNTNGTLFLQSGANIVLENTNGSNYFKALPAAQVELYYNGSVKLNTTNTGAIVTGICTATEFVPTSTQFSHRNIIINGDMNIAQRGAQSTSDGIKTVDRFGIGFATGAIQQDQITLTSSDTPYAYGFRKSYRLTNTTASTAASAARDIRYQIEAQDIATSGWDSTSTSSNITLSFWVKASVSQTYYVFHYVPDSQKNYNWNFTPSANTWTKITKTIPGASGVTFNNDNGPGMSIQIVAYYGNNFTASTDPAQNQWFAWSGSNRIPNMTSTWGGTTNATFEVTGMQLEVGSVATPFEHRSFTEELVRCQRFYQVGSSIGSGYGSAQGYARAGCTFATQMRTTPTFTPTNTSSGSIIAQGRSNTGFYVTYGSLSGTSAGIFNFTADAEF